MKNSKKIAPKITQRQLELLRMVQAAGRLAPTACDRRSIRALERRGLVAVSAKAITLTRVGAAYLGVA